MTKKDKIRHFHVLLNRGNLMHMKETMLEQYNVDSSKKLKSKELDELISALEQQLNYGNLTDRQYGLFNAKNLQHRKLLSLCYQIGWSEYDAHKKRHQADIERLGRWIKNYSKVKKPLIKMDQSEVAQVITQFEIMLIKNYKK